MAVPLLRHEFETTSGLPDAFRVDSISELREDHVFEVLNFLGERPLHTVFMASLIRDNGLVSPQNRGSFYACRNAHGSLEGVALLGHATVIEARTSASISSFARMARNCRNAHLIRGDRDTMTRFWNEYANLGEEPQRVCSEFLLKLEGDLPSVEPVDLRQAALEDLNKVLPINASMALEEGGVSPLQRDPSGFRQRTTRRIIQGRVWVWVRDDRLIFKADVVGNTPQVTYLEGIYVNPEERRKGYGLRGLTQLSSILMTSSQAICLTVNEQNEKAAAMYEKAGYRLHSHYETIYLS